MAMAFCSLSLIVNHRCGPDKTSFVWYMLLSRGLSIFVKWPAEGGDSAMKGPVPAGPDIVFAAILG
jgi:hypothetical protein